MLQLSMALLVVAAPSLKLLDATMPAIAKRAEPGRLGVAVYDFATGRRWSLRGDEGFPLQSVFKVMAGAHVARSRRRPAPNRRAGPDHGA